MSYVQQVQQIKQEVDNSTHYSLPSLDRISGSFWMTKPNTSPHLITKLFTPWHSPESVTTWFALFTTYNPQKKKNFSAWECGWDCMGMMESTVQEIFNNTLDCALDNPIYNPLATEAAFDLNLYLTWYFHIQLLLFHHTFKVHISCHAFNHSLFQNW